MARNTFSLIACFLFLALVTRLSAQEVLPLPPRPENAPTGSQLYTQLLGQSQTAQEEAIYLQIRAGNVPDFIRNLIAVEITETISGTPRTARIHVTPDYMAVGSNEDFFRIPMSAPLAQWVADLCQSSLTTKKITDRVYTAATVKLAPQFFNPADYDIDSWEIMYQHNTRIEQSRAGQPLGALVGGIKKDVVISNQTAQRPTPLRVTIYGWHQLNGDAIQPLSSVHENTYRDYSHGTRLVLSRMTVDGAETTVQEVLMDPVLNVLLSDEGPFPTVRYPAGVPPVPQEFPFADAFPASGRELLYWTDRFTANPVVAFSPAAPGGDGSVLIVRDTSGGIDTASVGDGTDADYFVQAQVYCEYRPQLAGDGFDRVGIFARDNGNGLFTGQSSGGVLGNCYGMAWQSDTGRLWCFKTVGGVLTDLNPVPVFFPSTGWKKMRVELDGPRLRFLLDGQLILATTDTTFQTGKMGVGYQEVFTSNANLTGTRAENFLADELKLDEGWGLY